MRLLYGTFCLLILGVLLGCSEPGSPASVKATVQSPVLSAPEVCPPEPAAPVIAAAHQYAPEPLPAEAVPAPSPAELPAVANEAVEAVLDEVSAMRQEMVTLRHELSGQIEELVSELRKENEELRKEVTRLSTLASGGGDAGSRIPVPGGEKESESLAPAEANSEPAKTAPELPEVKGPARPFVFTSVKEWGRSPEDVARLSSKASSLVGVVGTVPPGSSEKDLIALGRQLRDKYQKYDNINIEVFDDSDAAKQYAERNTVDGAHQVLSVSKHKASGRDSIQVYRAGNPIDVTSGEPR